MEHIFARIFLTFHFQAISHCTYLPVKVKCACLPVKCACLPVKGTLWWQWHVPPCKMDMPTCKRHVPPCKRHMPTCKRHVPPCKGHMLPIKLLRSREKIHVIIFIYQLNSLVLLWSRVMHKNITPVFNLRSLLRTKWEVSEDKY